MSEYLELGKSQNNMSLDRIDSLQSYTLDNIQLMRSTINIMKSDLEQNSFIEFCDRVVQ